MEEGRFKLDDFDLYRQAREFRKKIYHLARQFPDMEKYHLRPQMRRAAASVTNNIAEGHGRWHYLENMRFCRMARGSIDEIIDDLNICVDEGYAQPDVISTLKEEAYALIWKINSYIAYLRKSKQGGDK